MNRRLSSTSNLGTYPRAAGSCLAGAVLSLLGATFSFERSASAEELTDAKSACIASYESLQEARARGALRFAREQAFECASSVCPGFIQKDCATWLDEIEAELPAVSFDVHSGGKQLDEVRVFEGDRLLAERVDGVVELDPGVHSLRFEASGRPPVTRSVEVTRGARGQRVSVELPAPPPAKPPRRPSVTPPPPEDDATSAAPWVAGAVGMAGVAGFAILGASGLSEEGSLERTCAPRCSQAELRSVRTKYLLADVSLGVGVAGLLVGGYLLLAPDSKRKSAQASSVRLQVTGHGALASVRRSF